MVAVVSGSGAGLLNSSLGLLGQGRLAERWQHGAAGESGFVNIANGNLVLQRRDDFLAAPGVDLKMVRTYNSQGEFAEGSGRQWKIGLKKQVALLDGSASAARSTVLRLEGDGSLTQFDYDSSSGRYLNKNGSQSLELDGQKWTWRDQSGNGYYETYDQANDGRVLAAGDSGGERLHYEYRDDGLVSLIRTASGDVTFFEYDSNGNLSQYRTVAADSGKEQVRVHYGYDSLERLASVTTDLSPEDHSTADGNTYVIQYGYDGESSRVASVEQSDGTRVEMTYQQSGGTWKVTSITDAQGTISIEYQQGRTVLTDGSGVVTAYGYDEAGRLLSVAGPGGVAQASFAYDAQGNMVHAALADGTAQDYEYDTRGQRVAVRGADGMLIEQRGFAPDGRLLAEISYDASFQASLTNYVYDSARRLAFVVAPDGQVQEYQYDSAGQRIATLRYPDVRYSGASRTEAELRAWAANATPQRTSFTYDVRGLVASQTDGAGTTSFVHDQAGQLLQVIAPDGSTTQYTYDGLGRVQATVRTDGQMNISNVDQASTVMVTSFKDGQVSSSVSSGSEMMFASEPMAMAASEPVYDATITGTADGETLNGTAGNDLIEGAGGDDSLYGGSGNDMIDGGEGGDQIWGGDGSDTIKGGLGASGTDDSLRGEAGADTYIYELGSGKDWIYGQREEDTLQLGVGIDPNDVTFERYGSNLELVIRPNGGDEVGRIVLVNQVYDGTTADSGIKQIVYADGTVWDAAFIRARAVSGSGANDVLRGTEGNDSVLGNGGSDTIYGGGGDDTLDGGTEADRLYGEAGNDSLRGAAGSDTIDGGDGNDYLDGGADGDELFGGNGNDTLTGGQGAIGSDDRLFGGAGADTYVYELGGGKDWIAAQRDEDTLKLGAGINPADVGFERNGDNLELVVRQGGTEVGRVVLINQALDGTASETGVMQIVYADGTVWDAARIRTEALLGTSGSDVNLRGYSGDDTIAGNGGNDSLYGGDGNDVLDGGQGTDQIWGGNGNDTIRGGVGPGSGDDRLWGEAGADTYIYELGDGKDTVFGQRNEDTLQLGAGINPADVSFERVDNNVEVVIRQAGAEVGRVVLWNQANDVVSSESGVMRIVFADGSSIDAATIRARAVGGGSGNDELRGTEGNDTIPGRAGDDTIYGGAGNDILDGGADHDRLYGEAGNDTVLGNTGDDSIYGGAGDDVLDGGAGTDTIWGGDGNDTISAGSGSSVGNDSMRGEGGADTYIYELGSGTDWVYGQRNEDTLQFGTGISPEDISFTRYDGGGPNNLDVVIRKNDVEVGRVVLVNQANDTPDADSGVQKMVFADGTIWDAAEIRARALIGTDGSNGNLRGYNSDDVIEGNGGDDWLYGGSGNDTLNGGAGNDVIYGEVGNDTFVYELGGGNDTVNGQRNEDTLRLGAGINRGDVSFVRSNYNVDVVIRQNGSEVGRVVLVNQIYDGINTGVMRVAFADGTAVDAATIRSLALSDLAGNDPLNGTAFADSIRGGAGNDTIKGMDGNDSLEGDEGIDYLYGGNGADTLRGGSGNDSLSGEAGADTYLYELGDGNEAIYGQRTEDVLRLGEGISPGDISVEKSNVSLILVVRQNGTEVGRITLDWQASDQGANGVSGVKQVAFADGTVWDTVEMKRRSLIGTDERDRIFGYNTDDLIQGNGGDDDLYGGSGNDTLMGGSGVNTLTGETGNDLLLGGGDKDLIYGGDGDDVLEGGGGADRMWAGAGNDTIRGGMGNDEMYGDAGLDRFVYELGDGNDSVTGQRGEDTLQLGFGISPADVSVLQSSSDLILVIRQAGIEAGRITLVNFASDAYDSGVKQLVFADGTVWEAAKIRQLPLNGSEGNDDFHGYNTNDTIKGNGGNDRIYGREGDDFIDGGAGGDWLSGENGNDTVRGGTGNDTLYGNAGADTYLYELGDGNDAINGVRTEDTLQLGAGISPGDVAIIRGYDRLDVVIRQGGIEVGRIELNGQSSDLPATYSGVMQIVFADGTRWDSAMIRLLSLNGTEGNDSLTGYNSDDLIQGKGGADTLFGGDGNDSIFGEAGNDSLNGGNGNDMLDGGTGYDTVRGGAGNDTLSGGIGASSSDDLLYGEAGADTYTYELGSYKDWVYGQRNEDTLRLGIGIAPADVSFTRNGDNLDLVIIQGGVEVGRVVLVNQAADHSTPESGVMQVVFADGTVWNAATIRARALIDSDGSNANLGGYNSDDYIAGNGGNDVISDPNGSDTIDGGAGNDTITDKGTGNNLISGGSGHDSITYSTSSDNTIDGGTGNDTVKVDKTVDNAHFNQVAGGRGNDRLEGSNAADSYLFNRGDGQDTISDYDLNDRKRLDRLVFGDGITQADLTISRVGVSNLSIRVSDLGNQTLDEIVIENWFETSGRYQLERIDFADGSSMSKEQVSAVANVRYGTEGNDPAPVLDSIEGDVFYGLGGNDTIIATAKGNDYIDGGSGNDSIVDNGGFSNVLLGGDGADTVVFWEGASNTVKGGTGNDLITVKRTDMSLGLSNVFEGGQGNDVIQSGNSTDTYVFNRGDGHDTILDNSGSASVIDRLRFGPGITSDQLSFARLGNDLIVLIGGGNVPTGSDQVTIASWFAGAGYQIERFEFEDGSVILSDAMPALRSVTNGTGDAGDNIIFGTAGNDDITDNAGGNNNLQGLGYNDTINFSGGNNFAGGGIGDDLIQGNGSGSNVLSGGTGNDRMYVSGTSSDTYLYGRGDGMDSVKDGGGSDVVVFAAGITLAHLNVSRNGNNLVVRVVDALSAYQNDQITFEDWFVGSSNVVEKFRFADGLEIAKEQIVAMLVPDAKAGGLGVENLDPAALVAGGVNAGNGNFVLQQQDTALASIGLDVGLTRTYNSQAQMGAATWGNWQISAGRSVRLDSTTNIAYRSNGDGSESKYVFDGTSYRSVDGQGAYDKLAYDSSLKKWTWTDGATGIVETYDATKNGRLTTSRDTSGNTTTYNYTVAGALDSIVSASGEKIVLAYDTAGNVKSVRVDYTANGQAKSGTRVYYDYDAQRRLTMVRTDMTPDDNSIADGDVYWTMYSYDGDSGRIASIWQKDGSALRLTYQQDTTTGTWRVKTLTDAMGRVTSLTYGANGTNVVEDAAGHKVSYAYDASGKLDKVIDQTTLQVSDYEYDANGNVTSVTDAKGITNTFGYDAAGNQTLDEIAGVRKIERTFVKPGLVQTSTVTADGKSQTTRNVYDAQDRLRFQLSPEGRVTEWRYNAKGEQTSSIEYAGNIFSLSALAVNQAPTEAGMVSWIAGVNRSNTIRTDFTYDSRSLVKTATTFANIAADGSGIADGTESTKVFTYDHNGLLLQSIDTNNRQVSYSYDALGRLVATVDARPDVPVISTTLYDEAAQTSITTGINGNSVTEVRNRNGQLLSTISRSAVATGITRIFYDAAGRPVMTQDAAGVRSFVRYDAAGRKVADIDGDGSVVEYKYGQNGQLTHTIAYAKRVDTAALVGADGKPDLAKLAALAMPSRTGARHAWNIYDAVGRLVQAVDGQGNVTVTAYDGAGLVTSVVRHAETVTVAGLEENDVLEAFALKVDAKDSVSRFFYDKDGNRLGQLDGAGNLAEFVYDAAGQLKSSIVYTQATEPALRANGSLDDLRAAVAGSAAATNYLYNGKGQQVGSVDAMGTLTETVYDKEGNVSRKVRYGTTVAWQDGATLATLRPTAPGADRSWNYTYTKLNQLETETAPDQTVTRYRYDKLGKVTSVEHFVGTAVAVTSLARYDVEGRVIAEIPAEAGWRVAAAGSNAVAIDAVWSTYAVSYKYDDAGRRISMTAPGGARTLYFYDADGRLAHTVNTLGQVASSEYNGFNQIERSVTYDGLVPPATLATLNGGNASALSEVLKSLAPVAIATRTLYNENGQAAAIIDPMGALTAYHYDAFGNVSETFAFATPIDPGLPESEVMDGIANGTFADAAKDRHQRFAYDNAGRLTATFTALQTAQSGLQWSVSTRSYDGAGKLVTTTAFATPITHAAPTGTDAAAAAKSASDERVRIVYDVLGRVTAMATAQSLVDGRYKWTLQTREYDANGLLAVQRTLSTQLESAEPTTAELNAAAAVRTIADGVTRYAYDEMGRVTHTAVAQGLVDGALRWSVSSVSYDKAGNVTHRTAYAAGLSSATLPPNPTLDDYTAWLKTAKADAIRDRTSRYTYDAGHRLHSTIDAEGGVISQEYDARGNVAQVANGSNVTRNVYDSANRLQYSINAEGAVTEFRYDALGRAAMTLAYANPIETQSLTAETTPQTVGDLLRSKADPAQDHVVYNVHDKDGRVRFSVDALGYVKEMQYDALGRVVATLSYANNVVDSGLSEKTTPDDVTKLLQGKMDSAYDRVAHHIYDSDSRLRFTVDGRGYVKEMQYDALGRVRDTLSYNDTADLNPLSLASLSAFGAARADADLTRHESFEYDGQGHLVSTTDGEGHTEYFRYDAAGNKTGFTNKLRKDWTYHYNVAGQLIEEIAPQVSVMNNDRIASTVSLITRLAYDALGNLESRTEGAGVPGYERTTRYRYDRVGRQVTTVLPSFSIYNEGETPSTEKNAGLAERESGEVSTTVTYDAQGNAISNLDVGGHTSLKIYDKMGRVKYEIDAKGQVTGHKYDAFGQQIELTRYAVASSWDKAITYSEGDVAARLKLLDHSQDRTIRTIYDRLGHVAKVVEPASYVFDELKGDNGTAPGYASLARVTENEYNAFGELRLKSVYGADADLVVRTAASEERYYYNKRGERIAQFVAEDAVRGYLTTTDYNAFGEVGKVTEFSQRVDKSAMTNSSFGTAKLDELDRVTKYDYDDVGQKKSETRYNVDVGVWSEDTHTMTTGHREVITSFEHDAVGNLLVTTDASGARTRSYYDATGRVTAVTVQGGNGGKIALTTFDRDVYGNVVKQTAYAHEVAVDAAGAYSAPLESTDDRTTWTKYNINGYGIAQTDAEGKTSFTSYDIFGRVAKQWQHVTSVASAGENFVRTTYTITQYDELGQVSKVITPGPAVKVENHYVLSEIVSSAQNEGHPLRRWASSSAYTGSNKVSLKYPDLGNGFIKVELRYKTQMGWFREDGQYGGMDSYTYTEEGIERVRTFTDMEVGPHMWMSLRGATGVTVSWDDASEPFGGIEAVNGVKVYVLDAAGEWVLKYESQGAELAGAATVTDNMRGNVGTTEHQNIYNAFGELTGKRLNGKRYETSEYDNAGNLWRTNSGDGVDKVMFYNVGGQVTTQLRNADDNVNFGSSGPYKSAQAVAEAFKREDDLAKHIVRNETSYDLMGRAVSQTGAIHNSLASGATSPTAIVSTTISAQVIECTQVSITEADQVTGQWSYVWSGSNKVQVEFNLLESLGNGDLMVEVLYHCNGVGYGPANDGSGDYAPAFFVTADKLTPGSTPGTYSTIVEDVQAPRIDYVNAVRIYKKDLNGQWVLLGETPATTRNGPFLSMGTPEDGLATVRLEYTTASGQVVSMSSADQAQHDAIHRFGERALFDLSALPVGTVSYRLYRSANSDLAETMVESGQLTVATDANGQRTASIETTTVNPGMSTNGRATSRQRLDRWGNVEEVTDPRNPEWSIRYIYNDNNQLTKQERVAPGLLKTLGETYFDAVGREVGTRDGRGYLQRKVYGEDGRLKQEIHADGGLVEYDYNLFGDRTQLRKYTGRDTEGNLQYVATDYAYDHLSRLLKVTNKAVSWRVYEAGTPDNLQVDIDYAANLEVVESYAYDEVGRRTVTTDGLGGKRILRYDHAGNVLAEVDQMGNATSYAYDAFGNKTAMVVQDDFTRRIQTWDYDDYGHVLAHVDAGNARIAYTYTKLGQLKSQTSDERRNGATTIRGQNIVYTYDGDRVVRINDNTNNKETSYTYDLAGNHLSEITRANGDYVQNSYIQYDQLNRMTRVADGDFNVVIGYDDAGNRETVETTYTHLVKGRTSFKVMNKFDAMNRQILVDGDIVKDQDGKDTAVFGRRSHEIEYDWAGNRTSDKYYAGPTNYEAVTTQRYIYDGAGRLSTVIQDGNSVDERLYDRAGRQIRSGASAGYGLVDPAMLDKWKIPKEYRITQYDAAGRMTHQRVRDLSNATLQDVYFKVSNVNPDWAHQGYSTAGQLRGYYVVAPNGGATTAFKSDYIWFDSAKEVKASASNSGGVSTTTTEYDSNGHLVKVIDAPVSVSGRTREYINDFNGQVLMKIDGGNRLRSLVANGQLLGTNNGYEVDTNFVNPYQSATSSSMTAASSAYTVRTDGETPSSIAQNMWGDSKLWYLIADANALAGDDALAAGKVLRIPPRANTIHNDYQTFKPYNAADAVGNTAPEMPTPAAPSGKGGCGVVGQIVMVVVAVAVTAMTGGAAIGLLGQVAGSMLAATAGSIASQAVGMAIGAQEKFSWKGVALSAISAGVTAGVSSYLNPSAASMAAGASPGLGGALSGPSWQAVAGRAVLSNIATQGIANITGLQKGFNWKSVAAAGVAAAVGQHFNKELGLIDSNGNDVSMDASSRILRATVSGFAAGTTAAVMRGGRFTVTQVAADAFGNALGSSLAEAINNTEFTQTRALKSTIDAERASRGLPPIDSSDSDSMDTISSIVGARSRKTVAGRLDGYRDQLTMYGMGTDDVNDVIGRLSDSFHGRADVTAIPEDGMNAFDKAVLTGGNASLAQRVAAFGSTAVDDVLQGSGRLVKSFGETLAANPLARYALEGIDFAAGPAIWAARKVVMEATPVGEMIEKGQGKIIGRFADQFASIGYNADDAIDGGVGGLTLGTMIASGASGALSRLSGLSNVLAGVRSRLSAMVPDVNIAPFAPAPSVGDMSAAQVLQRARVLENLKATRVGNTSSNFEVHGVVSRLVDERLRLNLTSNASRQKNFALADYSINGNEGTLYAISNINSPLGTAGMPVDRFFATFNTPAHHRRDLDSEMKLFENFAVQYNPDRLAVVPDVHGNINLMSELKICPSCNGGLRQFEAMFPNIVVNPMSGPNTSRPRFR